MVRLQKQKAYRYKRKTHFKHVVVIPEKILQELGWHTGQELGFTVNDTGLLVKPSTTVDIESEEYG